MLCDSSIYIEIDGMKCVLIKYYREEEGFQKLPCKAPTNK